MILFDFPNICNQTDASDLYEGCSEKKRDLIFTKLMSISKKKVTYFIIPFAWNI